MLLKYIQNLYTSFYIKISFFDRFCSSTLICKHPKEINKKITELFASFCNIRKIMFREIITYWINKNLKLKFRQPNMKSGPVRLTRSGTRDDLKICVGATLKNVECPLCILLLTKLFFYYQSSSWSMTV